jgi:hypothetical protein
MYISGYNGTVHMHMKLDWKLSHIFQTQFNVCSISGFGSRAYVLFLFLSLGIHFVCWEYETMPLCVKVHKTYSASVMKFAQLTYSFWWDKWGDCRRISRWGTVTSLTTPSVNNVPYCTLVDIHNFLCYFSAPALIIAAMRWKNSVKRLNTKYLNVPET